MSLCNSDENKTFGVVLRTPVDDSTGIPHILEHSVLCGSRKYPIKASPSFSPPSPACSQAPAGLALQEGVGARVAQALLQTRPLVAQVQISAEFTYGSEFGRGQLVSTLKLVPSELRRCRMRTALVQLEGLELRLDSREPSTAIPPRHSASHLALNSAKSRNGQSISAAVTWHSPGATFT